MPPEELLIRHCAPTLAGLKVGSLFCYRAGPLEVWSGIAAALSQCGLSIQVLRRGCQSGFLVYLYRPAQLEQLLYRPQYRRFLASFGYPENLRACLSELFHRLEHHHRFPHEVGLFLGYPLEDVAEFIRQGGKDFCCSGRWKVYRDADAAEARFRQYAVCTNILLNHYRRGTPLPRLTVRRALPEP